jgi:protein-L-isoaspartate(D-aspartate) O-methyltransferase
MDHKRVRDWIVETVDVDLSSIETVLRAVPRHRFVPEAWRDLAYANRPLPLGNGTTISVPSVMASMVDHLALSSGYRVLKMGTGSEYYATVVAEVVGAAKFYRSSTTRTSRRRQGTETPSWGDRETSIRIGDGREDWPENAPYNAAYATFASRGFLPAVVDQVRVDGLPSVPIGIVDTRLIFAKKRPSGDLDRLDSGAVQGVPMRGPERSFDASRQ